MSDDAAQLRAVLVDLKAYNLLARTVSLKVGSIELAIIPPGEKANPTKDALERAQLDEETMYASAGA